MKRRIGTILSAVIALLASSFSVLAQNTDPRLPPIVDKSKYARLIITTDVECDDMNGLTATAFFAGDMDIVGIVRSSGEWRWDGDRNPNDYSINLGTTLEQVMAPWASPAWRAGDRTASPPWRTRGEEPFAPNFVDPRPGANSGPPSKTAGSLTHYREADDKWLLTLFNDKYRKVYPSLVKHDPNYPDPDYLVSIIRRGNVAFEGDYRFDSPGSELIVEKVLDDDMRPLFISAMGGVNTVTRAFVAIRDRYKGTDKWESVLEKIRKKVVINRTGEDDSWARAGIAETFTFLGDHRSAGGGGISSYGSPDLWLPEGKYPADSTGRWHGSGSQPDVNAFHNGRWLAKNLVLNHGPLAGYFVTMLDGKYIGSDYSNNAEPRTYQWGRTGIHDAKSQVLPPRIYAKYDWTGYQGTGLIMNSGFGGYTEAYQWGRYGAGYGGVRGSHRGIPAMDNNGNYISGQPPSADQPSRPAGPPFMGSRSGQPFSRALFEELAARADWSIAEKYEDANHAPVITVGENRKIEDHFVYALPGQDVRLEAKVSDPDGDTVYTSWWVWAIGSAYSGAVYDLSPKNPASPSTTFTVPADARSGDYFNFVIEARDDDASAPMTRFNQIIVRVVDELPAGAKALAAAPEAVVKTSAVVTVEKGELIATPGEAVFLKAHVKNPGKRVHLFWKVNKDKTAYSGASRLLRTWGLANYSTGFTVPWDARQGDSILVEMWGGEMGAGVGKYNQVIIKVVDINPLAPVITSASVYPRTIAQGRAVDLDVTVEGKNLEGKTVTATVLGKTAVVKNGKAVIKLTADDVFEYGLFKTQVEVEGTWIKYDADEKALIRSMTKPKDLWSPTVSANGDNTVVTFSKDVEDDVWQRYPRLDVTFGTKKKVVFGTTTIDAAKVSAAKNTITIERKAAPGEKIVISGVRFADLFPRDSFDFTLTAP